MRALGGGSCGSGDQECGLLHFEGFDAVAKAKKSHDTNQITMTTTISKATSPPHSAALDCSLAVRDPRPCGESQLGVEGPNGRPGTVEADRRMASNSISSSPGALDVAAAEAPWKSIL